MKKVLVMLAAMVFVAGCDKAQEALDKAKEAADVVTETVDQVQDAVDDVTDIVNREDEAPEAPVEEAPVEEAPLTVDEVTEGVEDFVAPTAAEVVEDIVEAVEEVVSTEMPTAEAATEVSIPTDDEYVGKLQDQLEDAVVELELE